MTESERIEQMKAAAEDLRKMADELLYEDKLARLMERTADELDRQIAQELERSSAQCGCMDAERAGHVVGCKLYGASLARWARSR